MPYANMYYMQGVKGTLWWQLYKNNYLIYKLERNMQNESNAKLVALYVSFCHVF